MRRGGESETIADGERDVTLDLADECREFLLKESQQREREKVSEKERKGERERGGERESEKERERIITWM